MTIIYRIRFTDIDDIDMIDSKMIIFCRLLELVSMTLSLFLYQLCCCSFWPPCCGSNVLDPWRLLFRIHFHLWIPTLPLAEALLHFCSICTGYVSERAQIRAPIQRFASSRGSSTRTGRVRPINTNAASSGVRLVVLILCTWMFYHPHGQHRDVLSVCFPSSTWDNKNTPEPSIYHNVHSPIPAVLIRPWLKLLFKFHSM